MADLSRHPSELFQDAIDGRLDASARAAFDEHVASCEQCRRELDALHWTKTRVGEAGRTQEVPADFEARLRQLLDDEDRGVARRVADPRRASRRRVWLAGAAAAAAVLVAFWWLRSGDLPNGPADADAHLRAFQANTLTLEIQSTDPQTLEAHLRATGAPASRVYDFGMMGYTLVGVRTHTLGGQPTALAAYRSAEGRSLLCEMYVGRVDTLPSPDERRTHNGIDFLVYREGETTVVFWQEGTVVCVLSGTGDPEAIIALAFAKAIKV